MEQWEQTRQLLLDHTDLSKEAQDPVLRIQGEAGVGKTRFVYETLSEVPDLKGLLLYTLDEKNAVEFAAFLANRPELKAVIVVDDCSLRASDHLRLLLQGHSARLRVVVIDNSAPKSLSVAPELHLEQIPHETVVRILEHNFPAVAADRRQAYVQLSGGFVRLAADLCRHDAEIVQQGDVSRVIPNIRQYLRLRLDDDDDRKALQAISLLHAVGFREDVAGELQALCRWLSLDKDDVLVRVTRLKDAPGFVAAGGRYLYVTPKIIADVVFQDAWERWFVDAQARLSDLPVILTESFQGRVAASGDGTARRAVAGFFCRWATALSIAELADYGNLDRLLALGETDPELYVRLISSKIQAGSLDELRAIDAQHSAGQPGRWGRRRYLVRFLERVAAFPEYFGDAEAALFRLAIAESEPRIANNASGVWRQLFRFLLSGTAVPFSERLTLLKKRLQSSVPEERDLAVEALHAAFATVLGGPATRSVGPAFLGGRMVPQDWQPHTYQEWHNYLDEVLDLLEEAAASHVTRLREEAERMMLAHARALLALKRLEPLQRVFGPGRVRPEVLPSLLEQIEQFLWYDAAGAPGRPASSEEYIRKVREWETALSPTDFRGRLISVIGKTLWHRRLTGGDAEWRASVQEIARELLLKPELLGQEISWLCSDQAKSAGVLGLELGKLDENASQCEPVLLAAAASSNSALARGYVAGLLERHSQHLETVNRLLDQVQIQHARVAYEICVVGGRRTGAITRTLRLVDVGQLEPACLEIFGAGIDGEPLTGDELSGILASFAAAAGAGNEQAARYGVAFLGLLVGLPKSGAADAFRSKEIRELAWRVLEAAARVTSIEPGRWSLALGFLAKDEPARAAKLASDALAVNLVLSSEAQKVLIDIGHANPQSVMEALGRVMLAPNSGVYLSVAVLRGLISGLPIEVVRQWLEATGVEGARRLARHLPVPELGPQGNPVVPELTEFVFTRFEDDDQTFRAFCAGAGSFREYVGEMAPQKEAEASFAKQFLRHRLLRIRQWARAEIESAKQQADYWRQFDDEQKIR